MAGLDMIKWLGHASFRIDASQTVYIDPYKIQAGKPADIIFITHSHFDHCSEDDVNKIKKQDTILVAPSDCILNWEGERRIMAPGQREVIKGIPVSAVLAYNINKRFHPKQNNWVGYILDINGLTIYHAGDTDATPEMESLDVDIALLPIGGTYTMDVKEALSVLNKMKVKTVVPMHYGAIVGTRKDAVELKTKSRTEVVILKAT
jgi:L-ascorbate metabolism protein UlaG (beta-lactamase superfamily)